MRYVAIDLGDKRTGLAVGDVQTGLVTPLDTLEVPMSERGGEALLAELSRVLGDEVGPADLVIGLPLNMDGSEGPGAAKARDFGARLAERTGRKVHFHDERLTSAEADWSMARSGLTHKGKKQRRDALAAAVILRDFLAANRNAAGPSDIQGTPQGWGPDRSI